VLFLHTVVVVPLTVVDGATTVVAAPAGTVVVSCGGAVVSGSTDVVTGSVVAVLVVVAATTWSFDPLSPFLLARTATLVASMAARVRKRTNVRGWRRR
jgi:NAD(P)H-hydrate repair Nnr-like enzyme with NAD(P)H-hydrate dehydratase domain